MTLVPSSLSFFIVETILSAIFQSFPFNGLDLFILFLASLFSITSFLSIYILTGPVIYRNIAWVNRNLKSFEIQYKVIIISWYQTCHSALLC